MAGPFDGRSNIEKVAVAVQGELDFRKRYTCGEGCAHEQKRRGFGSTLGRESRSGFFGFAQDVGHFVFAADVRVALEFTCAGRGEKQGAAGRQLRFHVAKAGNNISVEASAWTGDYLETLAA